jgi:hypothetical protein
VDRKRWKSLAWHNLNVAALLVLIAGALDLWQYLENLPTHLKESWYPEKPGITALAVIEATLWAACLLPRRGGARLLGGIMGVILLFVGVVPALMGASVLGIRGLPSVLLLFYAAVGHFLFALFGDDGVRYRFLERERLKAHRQKPGVASPGGRRLALRTTAWLILNIGAVVFVVQCVCDYVYVVKNWSHLRVQLPLPYRALFVIFVPVLWGTLETALVLRFFLQARHGARLVASCVGLLLLFLAAREILPAIVWGATTSGIITIIVYVFAGLSHFVFVFLGDDGSEYRFHFRNESTGDHKASL